jgi:hypothetical protein
MSRDSDEVVGRQECLGHVGRFLLVGQHCFVHGAHRVVGEELVHRVDDVHERLAAERVVLVLVDDEQDVLEAEDALGVLEDRVVVGGELRVGGERVGGVDVAAIEGLVLQAPA